MRQHDYNQSGNDKIRGERAENVMEIRYVVYLIDSIGEEFYVTQEDELVRVNVTDGQKPLVVKNLFQISAQLGRLRQKYPSSCNLFALEYDEFLERKDQLCE